jgi:endonuclease/exonuclease/phosphatase (EEP) superfamily protein YafD
MRSAHLLARRWATLALVGIGLASLAAWLARFGWPLELFAHFRWQLGAGAAALCIILLALRKPGLAILALGLAVLHGMPVVQEIRANVAPSACGTAPFTIASVNVQFGNQQHQRLLEWLAENPADVVVLQEVTAAWATALQATRARFPHHYVIAREDPYGIALLSRWPLQSVAAVDLAEDGLPSLLVTLQPAAMDPLQVLALHTRWPVTPDLSRRRNLALQRAADLVRDTRMHTVLAGDLNLTPFAPAFVQLLRDARLRDAFASQAWRPTWLAGLWPLALPIDHVLVSSAGCVERAEIGPDLGSDHRPVRVTLGWPTR